VEEFLKSKNITLYFTHTGKKSAIAERGKSCNKQNKLSHCQIALLLIAVIRTLMGRIARIWYRKGNHRYIDILDDIVKSYNNSFHRSIGMSPKDVTDKNAGDVFYNLYKDIINAAPGKPKFKIGQRVHVSGKKTIFAKGYNQQYGSDVYIIKEIIMTNPITYKLIAEDGEDVVSTYYAAELTAAASID